MNLSNALPGLPGAGNAAIRASVATLVLLLGACGGGSGSSGSDPVASCDPADAGTTAECGSVIVSFTDADGDFLNYTLDVVSLTLETANGRVVETLPRETRINFSDYVDLTELVTVATVPPATYVAGTIRLDYTDAEVFVEAGGASKKATVTDRDGTPLAQAELRITLSDRDQLTVRRGLPSLLQLDFDLAASHVVDIVPTPAIATAEPFIVAEVTPIDEKTTRVRGPLVEVDEAAGAYTVALRPFHHRHGDFGRMTVQTTDDTEFEVNGESFFGAAGLQALAAAGRGTPTVAGGMLSVAEREFTAAVVLAGSSVPGAGRDAVVGNVIARNGDILTVRGATIIPHDRRAHFHDDVLVQVGPDTRVSRDGDRQTDLGIDAISIGQRVTVRGSGPDAMRAASDADSPQILFDATAGAVRLHVTHLSGIVNAVVPGQVDIALQAIDRRRADVFDFSGTGPSPELDADPGNYEIATGSLALADFAAGKPVAVRGFPEAFGAAPPDFSGRTVIDFMDVRSALGVGWGALGTTAPFLSMGADGLVLDNQNADIDERHYIRQGPVLIDLTALESGTTIVPPASARTLYVIKTADSLRQYADFAEFADDLAASLDGATSARSMFARGQYEADSNVFTAFKLGVYLLEP
ncbi:MAG TPA: metallophosphoesterase [Woeseiaceae bacterium]|nr:metallophosphoesterase [Woeseiaceae bacterium]